MFREITVGRGGIIIYFFEKFVKLFKNFDFLKK